MNEGEARYADGTVDRIDAEGCWWRFELPYRSSSFSYRFGLLRAGLTSHVNGEGVHGHEPTDAADFRLRSEPAAPDWARRAVFYQIFVDRFCRSSRTQAAERELARWSDPVLDWPASAAQFYGGDLDGILERFDHLERLGVSALCLTPFFPSPESHRYSASAFDQVDPQLGGDEALVRMLATLHGRGLRCIGDLTLNHCGNSHAWFRKAIAVSSSVEASMFHFTRSPNGTEFSNDTEFPNGYATFQGVKGLPKLDYSSAAVHERMYRDAGSVVRRWLREPYRLDGWRLNVATMIGRLGSFDVNQEVVRGVLAALAEERDDAFMVAEIPHDPTTEVGAGGWPGTLMGAGFASPVRRWVAAREPITGLDLYRGLRAFAAAVPWQSLVSSVSFAGSHDHPRLRSVAGSRRRALVALFLTLTFPGIPMIYAGDEFGQLGETGDLARAPMPWPGTGWEADDELCDRLAEIVRLRRSTQAFAYGGFRWLMASPDAIAFERADSDDRVLCVAARAATTVTFPLPRPGLVAEPLLASCPPLRVAAGSVTCTMGADQGFGAWRLHPS